MSSSFAIEVPGEANPLTENLLVHVLRSASSSDPQQIQTGTKQLQQWEKSQGFYVHLQSAFLDRRLPLELRYLAVIQLKNGIDKYWRKTALNAVSKEDKSVIRSRIVDGALSERDNRLALQNALVIAKIARFEFPNDWPEAISSTLNRLRTSIDGGDNSVVARALLVLLHITKELSTVRLQKARQNLQSVTPELLHVGGGLYASDIQSAIAEIRSGNVNAPAQGLLHKALLAIKLVRRLIVAGYEHPNRDRDVQNFWQLTITILSELLSLTRSIAGEDDAQQLLHKHMLQLSKLHHEMARDHPAAFVLLPGSINLVAAYWSIIKELGETFGSKRVSTTASSADIANDESAAKTATEKFALRGMLIVRACIKMVYSPTNTFKYKHPQDKEERSASVDIIRNQVLTESFTRDVMEMIVTKFFIFRDSDLQEWQEQPEEWEIREEAEAEDFEFSIRPCAEKLFLDLAINYKDILVQPLLAVFFSIATLENEDVLLKDSIYTAVGLAAPVLRDYLDFDSFLHNTLVHEVQKSAPGYNIIRRRTAILIGQWITIKVSEQSKPTVYQIYQHLLTIEGQPLNDQVVRITAGRQFKNVVDDWDFNAQHFMPYAETILTQLMQLIGEVELPDTKLALLNTISLIVERLEHHITPFAERIVGLLPPLWDQSGDEHLMKQSILTVLARLISSMKSASLPLHSMVIPIIEGAVRPDSESQVYLLEDAMELWANMIVQTPTDTASDGLLHLTQYLFSIFELGSESLRKALEIADSYILLAPAHMLSDEMRMRIFSSMSELIGTLKPDANGLVFVLLECMIRAAERLGQEAAVNQTILDMHSSGIFAKLLDGLHGSWNAHCTTGPLAKEPPVDGVVETDYFAILSRLILGSTSSFCQAVAQNEHNDASATMRWLLEEWFSHFENIGDPSRRKLMCLALTKLLEMNQPWILVNLQSLMTMWTDIVREIYEDTQDKSGDSLVKSAPEKAEDVPEAPEDVRRRELMLVDPVHSIQTTDWIRHHLSQAISSQPNFENDWMVNVDREVIKSFGELGLM